MNKPKKLILVDFNNVCYQVVFSKWLVDKYKGHTTEQLPQEKLEELTRDSIKLTFLKIFNILEWNQDYQTDILFAKDGYRLWRRERLFTEYKAHRKGQRDVSSVDFDLVFRVFDRIWEELKTVLPFRFITLDHIETDDIIYETIMSEYDKYDKFQIYSTDGDFKQILRNDKVELYNPKIREFIEIDNVEFDLFEKLIRGDKSDGIPNIFAESINERQKPIFTTRIKSWFDDKKGFKDFLLSEPKETQKRFIRNKKLIDMRDIPDDIRKEIRIALEKNHAEFNLQNYLKMSRKYFIDVMEEKAGLIAQ
jgi:hypothetical protein